MSYGNIVSNPISATDAGPAAAKRAFDAMMEINKIDIAAIKAASFGIRK